MVPSDALNNALRTLGFTFKRQADRVNVWKKKGGTERVMVRRNVAHDEEYARIILRQAGMPAEEIDRFIAAVNN